MSLLPSRDTAIPDSDPKVIGVESEDADDVLSALSAGTARKLFAELTEMPAPPGELADRVNTSLQNAQYHLNKLERAGAIEIVDTAYSEKGREMDIYAPANRPLVICAGGQRDTSGIKSALTKLLGGLGVVALVSLFVQQLFGRGVLTFLGPEIKSGSAGGGSPQVSYFPNGVTIPGADQGTVSTVVTETAHAADAVGTAASSVLPPGLVFFAGGAVVLIGLFAIWRVDQ